MRQFESYIICTSPRSGSTMLCRLLREARDAGFPGSHFHEPSLDEWLHEYGFQLNQFIDQKEALAQVFQSAIAYGKGDSDIFGLRLQRHSFDFFIKQLKHLHPSLPDDKSRINAAFGNTLFIHLTRENKLDQAISYVRAKQSGLWHIAPDGTEIERLSEPEEPTYDALAISTQLEVSERMETEWRNWFQEQGIDPLSITYDELSAAPHATLVRILETLGLKHEHRTEIKPSTAKLADATNREWGERFLREQGRLPLEPSGRSSPLVVARRTDVAAVVFDLDGTLIDSAPDIHAASNRVLAEQGFAPLTFGQVRSFIGKGVPHLIERLLEASGDDPKGPRHAAMMARFVEGYETAVGLTVIYPGVVAALERLAAEGHRLGICTNKPFGPTMAVLDHLNLTRFFPVVAGGDSLAVRKPDPAPLVHVMERLGGGPAIYIGDSEVDAETAQRAGVPFLLYTEGYRKSPVDALPHAHAFSDWARVPGLVSDLSVA